MYKTELLSLSLPQAAHASQPAPQRRNRRAPARAVLAIVAAALCATATAQGLPPAAVPSAAPGNAAVPNAVAAVGAENAEQLSHTAAVIARLRQQQAVVEAQAGLAKAQADLAKANQLAEPPPPPSPLGTVVVPGASAPRESIRLLAVGGAPDRRVASLELGDGSVRDARVGSTVGRWLVKEVRLSEVVLTPRGRTGNPVTLRVDGTAQESAPVAAATAAARARKP